MTFDWQAHLRETAEYLCDMATWPGWTEYARARRDELIADPIYGEALKAEVLRVRERLKRASQKP